MSASAAAAAGEGTPGKVFLAGWLRLLRIPNLFTVPGDVFVGYFLLTGFAPVIDLSVLLPLCGASLMLYAAGLLFNDYFDAEIDRKERPGRPIPSGAVPRKLVLVVGLILMHGAFMLAGTAGVYPLVTAGVLGLFVFFYNAKARAVPVLGFTVMGLCRALSVMLGASAAFPDLSAVPVAAAVVIGLYIFAVSVLAWRETGKPLPGIFSFGPSVVLLAGFGLLLGLLGFTWAGAGGAIIASGLALAVSVELALGGADVPKSIGALIRCLIPVQAGILVVAAGNFTIVSSVIYLLWPFSWLLGRKFYGS